MLYAIKMNLTYEKYRVFGEFFQTEITKYTKKSRTLAKSFIVDGCIALILAYLLRNMILVFFAIFLFLSTPFFLALYKKRGEKEIRSGWDTNQSLYEGIEITIEFYEDYFEQTTELGTMKVNYDKLYKICEQPEYFYLMVSKNQAVIVEKAVCEEGLIDFLREKMQDFS